MSEGGRELATLAGGCFWCLEAVFERVRGVESVVSGYTGGDWPDPDYESVCSGRTGHAEAVQIGFDVGQVTFAELLGIFFIIHDPTTLNRQGNDVGTQYRSAIFFHSSAQQQVAREMIASLQGRLAIPVMTELEAAGRFYPAEAYHQHYFARNPGQGYCQLVVAPKVRQFLRQFPGSVKI